MTFPTWGGWSPAAGRVSVRGVFRYSASHGDVLAPRVQGRWAPLAVGEPASRVRADGAPVDAARVLAELLQAIDRQARREARTVPRRDERDAAERGFWTAMAAFRAAEGSLSEREVVALRTAAREILNPCLMRSRYWNRSYIKPHGFAGDFGMLEWMYSLEHDACADATQPAVVNVLDGLFATVHSVQAVWHRRHWFRTLVRDAVARREGRRCRVLDIACGGSRYVRDLVSSPAGRWLDVTFLDQDPAALAFLAGCLQGERLASHRLLCAPVRRLPDVVADDERFDVVIATGLFDYLTDRDAAALLRHMLARTAPSGVVAVSNFAPEDESKVVKDWVSDWRLIYRTADAVSDLFPDSRRPTLDRSPDGGLIYAVAQPAGQPDETES